MLPHLLVPALAAAIVASPARRLVTLNLAADNETLGLSVADHLAALHWYLPDLRVDTVLADAKWVGEPEPVHRAAGVARRPSRIGTPGRCGRQSQA